MATSHHSLKGTFILDHGKLHGSFFHRTVILICQHDEEGAFGLVLNRATGVTVGEALTANLSASLKELPLFHGGPVDQQSLSFLHSDLFMPDANVMGNLSLSRSMDTLIELGESFSMTKKLKVFAGYSGWSAGQLEDEMRRDTWMTHPASVELAFHPEPQNLWPMILKEKGGFYRFLADGPEDLTWN